MAQPVRPSPDRWVRDFPIKQQPPCHPLPQGSQVFPGNWSCRKISIRYSGIGDEGGMKALCETACAERAAKKVGGFTPIFPAYAPELWCLKKSAPGRHVHDQTANLLCTMKIRITKFCYWSTAGEFFEWSSPNDHYSCTYHLFRPAVTLTGLSRQTVPQYQNFANGFCFD